ncbi:hypothetical protein [Janthinobacterium sp. HLX7-2]|uniref:hypothetical protein n=1 Tax=Janthinobacterium sp. HLX7-2 TaxID=1259331 RepID=UPI003F211D18
MAGQLIFLDTEFTSFHDPELISIGLVAATGEEFYAEVPYSVESCSEFVRDIVLPLLGADPLAACSLEDLRIRLLNWLAIVKIDDDVCICCDSEFDEKLILRVFDFPLPSYVRLRLVGTRHINELLRYEFHLKNCLPEHHALNDARALRYAFREPMTTPSGSPRA